MLNGINGKSFDQIIGGKQVKLYKLQNTSGVTAFITNYGGRLVGLLVPDKNNKPTDIVAGFESLNGYLLSSEPFHGAIIGRYCNRIAGGWLKINGKGYSLSVNDPPHALHGGKKGFHTVVWDANQISSRSLELNYFSKHLEEGYPGNLHVRVEYTLLDDNSLSIVYTASTDQPTVINLTNHAYFNLNGVGNGNILNHKVLIKADQYIPIDATHIPTGQIDNVAGTPFDFRRGWYISARINDHNHQLKAGNGYNHNFVLRKHAMQTSVASVVGDKSGVMMELYTDQPGLQLYTANHFRGENILKYGAKDDFRSYLALETQHFPDSQNHPSFPSTMLNKGELFKSTTLYKFI